ncbi:hypothetical protein LguiA_000857 [Lonicera macranthoides]
MDGESIGEKGRERPSEAGSPPTKRRLPWLIISLIILNWALFFYSLYKNNCPSQTPRRDKCVLYDALGRLSFQPLQENAQFGPAMSTDDWVLILPFKLRRQPLGLPRFQRICICWWSKWSLWTYRRCLCRVVNQL